MIDGCERCLKWYVGQFDLGLKWFVHPSSVKLWRDVRGVRDCLSWYEDVIVGVGKVGYLWSKGTLMEVWMLMLENSLKDS